MLQKPKCPVIAIEEHYWDQELAQYYQTVERNPEVVKRLTDFGELRIKEMDEAGIDIQVISHGAPSMQNVAADVAVEMARRVNDRLAAICAQQPDRLAGFAALHRVMDEAELRNMAVDLEDQRTGIARALLAEGCRILRTQGVARLSHSACVHLRCRQRNQPSSRSLSGEKRSPGQCFLRSRGQRRRACGPGRPVPG